MTAIEDRTLGSFEGTPVAGTGIEIPSAAARDAAGDAAGDALAPTKAALQAEAHLLIERMIAVTDAA